MHTFLFFLLKSGICLTTLFMFYQIALRNHSFFYINRIYLIFMVLISLYIPLIVIQVPESSTQQLLSTIGYDIIIDAIEYPSKNASNTYGPSIVFFIIYATGGLLTGLYTILKYLKASIIVRNSRLNRESIVLYYVSTQTEKPFTFFKNIVLPSVINDQKEIHNILLHEMEHVDQKHWIDNIFIDLITLFQWFNPFVWILRTTIKLNHEYLADQAVLKKTTDSKFYFKMLMKYAVGPRLVLAVNFFSKSKLKNRIKMMTTNTTTKLSYLKYVLVLPLVGILITSFAEFRPISMSSTPVINQENVKISGVVFDAETREPIESAMIIIKGTNIGTITDKGGKYIIEAEPNSELNFIMNGWETISIKIGDYEERDILLENVLLKRSDEIIEIPPPPPPGQDDQSSKRQKVEYGIEIRDVDPDSIHIKLIKSMQIQNEMNKTPLVIIDGEKSSLEEIENFNSTDIESIGVLKGDSIVNLYDNEASHGVIIIRTKK